MIHHEGSPLGNRFPLANPAIFISGLGNSSEVKHNLFNFWYHHCPNIDMETYKQNIETGQKLVADLKKIAKDYPLGELNDAVWIDKIKSLATGDNAVALMWYLMNKCAENDNLYTEGAMVIHPNDNLSGKRIELFLRACGDDENYIKNIGYNAYTRISTHMHGRFEDEQWGLDLLNMGLPAQKHTILFGTLDDGTLYIKMEKHGCPPVFKQVPGSEKQKKMLPQFVGHTQDYAATRPITQPFISDDRIIKLAPRRENVPKPVITIYKKALKEALDNGTINKDEYEKNLTCIEHGLTEMSNALDPIVRKNTLKPKHAQTIDLTQLPKLNSADSKDVSTSSKTPPPTKMQKNLKTTKTTASVALNQINELIDKGKGKDLHDAKDINVVGEEVHLLI